MELPDQALAGFAGWLGYGHAQRATLWAARLQVNQPEIELFDITTVSRVPIGSASAVLMSATVKLPPVELAKALAARSEAASVSQPLISANRHCMEVLLQSYISGRGSVFFSLMLRRGLAGA